MSDAEVLVVGAGLAGLACAVRLHEAGRQVTVLEANDAVGGRVRTDLVEGFRLDRGFQVLLTGYPAARAQLDLDALDLRSFAPGVVLCSRDRRRRLVDPWQAPGRAVTSALPPALSLADLVRLLAWRRHLLRTTGPRLASATQMPTHELLEQRGFSARAVEGFLRPFLAGIFFDPSLVTSSRLAELVLRCFFRGEVAVPARGMQAIPEQLAARLPSGALRLRTRVERVEGTTAVVAGGEAITGDHLVVATDAPAAAGLLGAEIGVPAPGNGTTTLHFAADVSPVGGPELVLGAESGPTVTLAAMSDVADTYAPAGRTLVTVSTLEVPGDEEGRRDLEARVRAQVRGWYGAQVDAWRLLRCDVIPYAQPRQTPSDLPSLARRVRLDERRWVCGDHRDTGSIQGALVSGRRTADELLAC